MTYEHRERLPVWIKKPLLIVEGKNSTLVISRKKTVCVCVSP